MAGENIMALCAPGATKAPKMLRSIRTSSPRKAVQARSHQALEIREASFDDDVG